MPIHNNDVAEIFNRTADLLDIKGENPFRIRAYRNAARAVGGLSASVADMVKEGKDLSELAGVGKDLAGKIKEIVDTGKLSLLETLEKELPPGLSVLMEIPGMGPKRIKILFDKLAVSSVDDLKKAARAKKISQLPGFGEKVEENILEEIARRDEAKAKGERIKLAVAEQIVEPLVDYLKKTEGVQEIAVAGSYRRRMETVGDLDILAICSKGSKAADKFVTYEDVEKVLSKGTTRSSVVFRAGVQVDLRIVPRASYGAALLYFTGSKAHNIAIRKIAVGMKLKINEYGVFKGEKRVAGTTEKEVYKRIGLPYIEPELREDRGEIEAARQHRLPRLVSLADIRGDLHCHSTSTDGRYSLEEMAGAAKKLGYEYMAASDHSKHVTVAHGMDAKRLARQIKEIDRLNGKLKGLLVLKSIELDILEDGRLDLPDDILKELDLVNCSIHYKFNLPREKQTERVIKAMDNPYFNIFCHPSGRLINERRPYEVDLEKIMRAAKEKGCYLELNAHPDRLDLTDVDCKLAKEIGLKLAISTDAHRLDDLHFMRYGIGQARRGWLEAGDVLNTRSWDGLKKLLKRK
jgi:DNA polymerase (family 10)